MEMMCQTCYVSTKVGGKFTFQSDVTVYVKPKGPPAVKPERDLSLDLDLIRTVDCIDAPAALIYFDGQIFHANTAMQGLGANKGQPFWQMVHENIQHSLKTQLERGTLDLSVSQRFAMKTPGVDMTLAKINYGDGKATIFLCTVVEANGAAHDSDHWQTLVDQLPNGAWHLDLVTSTRHLSDEWRSIRGLKSGDFSRNTEENWRRHVHPEDIKIVNETRKTILAAQKETIAFSYREQHVRGHWVWIHCTARIIYHRVDKTPLYLLGTELDISKNKKDAARLEDLSALEQRWKISLESAGQGLWDHNIENGTSYCSDAWYHIRGLDPETSEIPVGEDWFTNMHPDDRDWVRQKVAASDAGETDQIAYEYRERHEDGHWIWVLSRGRIVKRGPEGQPLRVIGNDTDVTDIKQRAEEFSSLSKSLELAVSVAGIGAWEFDIETQETNWDRKMYEIFDLDPERMHRKTNIWEEQIHPEDRARSIEESQRSLKNGDDFELDYRIILTDGTVRHIRSRAAHYKHNNGRRKLMGVCWDITQDIEAAARLEAANELANRQNKALEAARAEMEYNASHDALTGLANRRKLDEVCKNLPDDARPAVLHIDLDRFKQINDTLGHAAGDQILTHAAKILSDNAPKDSLVARVGGDEFVILIYSSPPNADLENLAMRIITASEAPYVFDGAECRFGMSVGIATNRMSNEVGSTLFANADLALYLAKNEGRGRCRFYKTDLSVAVQSKKQLGDELLAALERDEFFCLYQPQFNAQTLQLSGVEALVRWRHPSGEIRFPDQFLPTAEEVGVVNRIDRLMLLTAIEHMQNWADEGLDTPRVSVNVSAQRLTDSQLIADLDLIDQSPGQFAFELLESVFLDTQNTQLAENLSLIRAKGVEIEIDDFGTGHASIVGLLHLKPTRLKIDRQLIQPIDSSDQQRQLVESILHIGRLQNIAVVAEGVETLAHIEILQELGCDYLQGFGLAAPMYVDKLTELLRISQKEARAAG
jgi:diguanylate cyclase (GGDEF)-like protein/PAS domain S-box-containing protein